MWGRWRLRAWEAVRARCVRAGGGGGRSARRPCGPARGCHRGSSSRARRCSRSGRGEAPRPCSWSQRRSRREGSPESSRWRSMPPRLAIPVGAWSGRGVASHTSVQVLDATLLSGRGLPAEIDDHFDVVFVDAPCSGTGTLRRHPEITWSLEPGAVDPTRDGALPALQRRILCASASRVRRGGSLCYATCSLLAEEDERVVEAFLAGDVGADFELADEPARLWLDDGRSDVPLPCPHGARPVGGDRVFLGTHDASADTCRKRAECTAGYGWVAERMSAHVPSGLSGLAR